MTERDLPDDYDTAKPETPTAGAADQALRSVESLLRAAAFHQAGHAVVGALVGAHVHTLELWEGPPPGGRVDHTGLETDGGPASADGVVRLIAYRLAGPIAERIAEGGSTSLQGESGYLAATSIMGQFRDPERVDETTDAGAAARLLLDHFGEAEEEAAAAVDHLALIVEGWVWDFWHAIAPVAINLLRYRHLTATEFRAIVPPLQQQALF